MAAKKSNSRSNSEWYTKPWTKITASIIVIASIFGFGFAAGSFKESIDWKVEKMQLVQEYNEKIQKQIDDCRNAKIEEYKKSAEELKRLIEELKMRMNEK